MTRAAWRFRLVATCIGLLTLVFWQSPVQTAADTKLDLTQDPGAFLARALHLWDDQAFFGQLQNQAYGYLFPMGPFFWAGDEIGLPGWIVQRLWWTTLLCVAFLGAVRLARVLGVESHLGRWTAGIAFALSVRMMTTLGPVSVESLPFVLAPWVVLPLVVLRSGGPVRRPILLSAAAVLLMGGVNAVATLAVAALGALWILVEVPRPVRLRALLAWSGAVLLATAWFLGPLLLLGRYSPPFLDWIESAAVTTSITDTSAVLRGATDWVAYVGGRGGPSWPAGWSLVTEPVLVAATAAVALAGILGLTSRRLTGRRFLVLALLLGWIGMSAAHVAASGALGSGVAAEPLRILLDGALSPLRNVHKLEAWVRLPLAIGAGATAGWCWTRVVRGMGAAGAQRRRRIIAGVALAVVAAGLVGSSTPLLRGDLTTGRTFLAVPGYWLETSQWLGARAQDGRALVLPGAAFGTYLWGETRDEPLQAYATSPWAVRDVVPLSSAGNIRMLDAVTALLSDGRGDPGLGDYLARAGVTHIVVRNDLEMGAVDSPRQVLVHMSLAKSGLSRVAYFGPLLRGFALDGLVADAGVDGAYPAVEIYAVDVRADDTRVVMRDASTGLVMTGEAEGLLGTQAVAQQRAIVRSGDTVPSGFGTDALLTDSGRRVEVNPGAVTDNRSRTLAPDDPWRLPRRVHDYVVTPQAPQPALTPVGVTGVRSSSSVGDADAARIAPERGPWAALDGSTTTSWSPLSNDAAPWWEVDLGNRRPLGGTTVRLSAEAAAWNGRVAVRITTDDGSREIETQVPGVLRLPQDMAGSVVRIGLPREGGVPVIGVVEVAIPGVRATRGLTVQGDGTVDEVSLRVRAGARDQCVQRVEIVCYPAISRVDEEASVIDRSVVSSGLRGGARILVRPLETAAVERLTLPGRGAALARASSTWSSGAAAGAQAAVDADVTTTWTASPGDSRPTLVVTLPRRAAVSWLRVQQAVGIAASSPLGVTVTAGGRSVPAYFDEDGYVRFPRVLTSTIRLEFTSTKPILSYDTQTGARSVLPVGITELQLGEADATRLPRPLDAPVVFRCGFGPVIELSDGRTVDTTVSTTVGGLMRGESATARSCEDVVLQPGTARVVVRPNGEFAPVSLTIAAEDAAPAPALERPEVAAWASTHREVVVRSAGAPRTLELSENFNPGWTATLDGARLEPFRVDGWRQAWIVPAGAQGAVTLDFAPDRVYRLLLLVGGVAVLLLLGLLLLSRRDADPQGPRPVPGGLSSTSATLIPTVSALIAAGPLAALSAALASRTRPRAARAALVAGWAMVVAPAILAPWPSSRALPAAVQAVAAVVVALGGGAVAGGLCASLREVSGDAPTAVPDAPPAGT